MSSSPVHWMYSSRPSSPSSIAASATNGLNVEPGGKSPATARFSVGWFALLAASAFSSFSLTRRDVDVRVEGRVRGEGEDLAGVHVQRDERATVRGPLVLVVREADPVLERLLGGALEVGVDRQPDVVAGLGQLAELALARDPAERVDEHAPLAAHPAQVGVVDGLDPRPPDAVARPVALVGLRLELLGVDLADVAEDVRGEDALLVVPQVRLRDLDAGELALVLHQVGGLELAHARVDRDGGERVALQALLHLVADDGHLELEQPGQAAQHRLTLVDGELARAPPARSAPACPACWRRARPRRGRRSSRAARPRRSCGSGCCSRSPGSARRRSPAAPRGGRRARRRRRRRGRRGCRRAAPSAGRSGTAPRRAGREAGSPAGGRDR